MHDTTVAMLTREYRAEKIADLVDEEGEMVSLRPSKSAGLTAKIIDKLLAVSTRLCLGRASTLTRATAGEWTPYCRVKPGHTAEYQILVIPCSAIRYSLQRQGGAELLSLLALSLQTLRPAQPSLQSARELLSPLAVIPQACLSRELQIVGCIEARWAEQSTAFAEHDVVPRLGVGDV